MTWIEATCEIYGPQYSPTKAEELTKVSFAEKNEVGEIGSLGRYRGIPIPYGSSTLLPPCQVIRDNAYYGVQWLLKTIMENRHLFEAAGATHVGLDLNVKHDGQCNLEFSATMLRAMGDSGIGLTISCYEDSDYVERRTKEAEMKLKEREMGPDLNI
jgi:hypothetical protein